MNNKLSQVKRMVQRPEEVLFDGFTPDQWVYGDMDENIGIAVDNYQKEISRLRAEAGPLSSVSQKQWDESIALADEAVTVTARRYAAESAQAAVMNEVVATANNAVAGTIEETMELASLNALTLMEGKEFAFSDAETQLLLEVSRDASLKEWMNTFDNFEDFASEIPGAPSTNYQHLVQSGKHHYEDWSKELRTLYDEKVTEYGQILGGSFSVKETRDNKNFTPEEKSVRYESSVRMLEQDWDIIQEHGSARSSFAYGSTLAAAQTEAHRERRRIQDALEIHNGDAIAMPTPQGQAAAEAYAVSNVDPVLSNPDLPAPSRALVYFDYLVSFGGALPDGYEGGQEMVKALPLRDQVAFFDTFQSASRISDTADPVSLMQRELAIERAFDDETRTAIDLYKQNYQFTSPDKSPEDRDTEASAQTVSMLRESGGGSGGGAGGASAATGLKTDFDTLFPDGLELASQQKIQKHFDTMFKWESSISVPKQMRDEVMVLARQMYSNGTPNPLDRAVSKVGLTWGPDPFTGNIMKNPPQLVYGPDSEQWLDGSFQQFARKLGIDDYSKIKLVGQRMTLKSGQDVVVYRAQNLDTGMFIDFPEVGDIDPAMPEDQRKLKKAKIRQSLNHPDFPPSGTPAFWYPDANTSPRALRDKIRSILKDDTRGKLTRKLGFDNTLRWIETDEGLSDAIDLANRFASGEISDSELTSGLATVASQDMARLNDVLSADILAAGAWAGLHGLNLVATGVDILAKPLAGTGAEHLQDHLPERGLSRRGEEAQAQLNKLREDMRDIQIRTGVGPIGQIRDIVFKDVSNVFKFAMGTSLISDDDYSRAVTGRESRIEQAYRDSAEIEEDFDWAVENGDVELQRMLIEDKWNNLDHIESIRSEEFPEFPQPNRSILHRDQSESQDSDEESGMARAAEEFLSKMQDGRGMPLGVRDKATVDVLASRLDDMAKRAPKSIGTRGANVSKRLRALSEKIRSKERLQAMDVILYMNARNDFRSLKFKEER